MTTYHRLLLLTTLGSALLTFFMLQMGEVSTSANQQSPAKQMQSAPLPQATEYYALGHPRLMTLVWQPCTKNTCQSQFTGQTGVIPRQQSEIGI